MLVPGADKVYVIRIFLLEFAYPASNPNPIYQQQIYSFANGGQLVTDMAIIEHKFDPYNVADFKAGFANLYGIEYYEEIREFPKMITDCDYSRGPVTMGDLGAHMRVKMDRDRYLGWRGWCLSVGLG